MSTSPYVGMAEAADLLHESRETVRRRVERGDIRADKLRGHTGAWLLNRDDVERVRAERLAETRAALEALTAAAAS